MTAAGEGHSPAVAVGSTNPAKVEAVRSVVTRLWPDAAVTGTDVPSGVPAQPVGADETLRGARHRAAAALAATEADLAIGLEGGVEFDAEGCWLINHVAAVDRAGRSGHARGLRLLLPPFVAAEIQKGRELGEVMDALVGRTDVRKREGAVGVLTGGAVTRRQMWEVAVAAALAPNRAEAEGAGWYGPAELAGLSLTPEIAHWCRLVLTAAAGWPA